MEDEDRGFHKEGDSWGYRTRGGEYFELSKKEYIEFRILEDIMNRLMFINTRDIKRTLESPIISKRGFAGHGKKSNS